MKKLASLLTDLRLTDLCPPMNTGFILIASSPEKFSADALDWKLPEKKFLRFFSHEKIFEDLFLGNRLKKFLKTFFLAEH